MNLGVETGDRRRTDYLVCVFQHSLMNLGVETLAGAAALLHLAGVSAFSDESWGGDPI